MSARSPRGSLSGVSSAEVADDFAESLKDLQFNNRHEISNLTVIAKENTEHAQAISKTLETHIRTTPPMRKLPSLYLLDSIVKNVGTPYTVYLGRDLFGTFMEAYRLVDGTTRRNMEGMLKTWKDPVPGSMDPRPVFPTETVRPIENALIKFKTAALQGNRQVPTQLQPQPDYRNTPTPPNFNNRFGVPPSQGQSQPYLNQQSGPHPPTGQLHPQPTLSQPHSYQYPQLNPQPVNEVENLKRDVGALVALRQGQFGADPFNSRLRDELQALLDLQKYLNENSQVEPVALQQIRDRVSALSGPAPAQPNLTPQPGTPQWQAPSVVPQASTQFSRPPVTYPQPPPTQTQPALPRFAPGALDGLQALLANGQKPGTPQMRAAVPALQNAGHSQLKNVQNQAAAAPAFSGNDLIASLAKNGLLPAAQPTPPTGAPANAPAKSTAALLQSLQGILPSTSQSVTPTIPPAQLGIGSKPRIPMTAAALKTFRPELVTALYEAQPNQCSTCGRRFGATDAGRAKKDRHLDWHFRTNQRMADPSITRGIHRDWFPTELDWIQQRDFDPSTAEASAAGASSSSPSKKGLQEDQKNGSNSAPKNFVRAPPGVTRNTCTICFEEMRSSYSAELQDWIFADATMHNGKIVHASCLAEMQKGTASLGPGASSLAAALASAQGQRQRSATPDSTGQGKRKAEGQLAGGGMASRLKMG